MVVLAALLRPLTLAHQDVYLPALPYNLHHRMGSPSLLCADLHRRRDKPLVGRHYPHILYTPSSNLGFYRHTHVLPAPGCLVGKHRVRCQPDPLFPLSSIDTDLPR